MLHAAYSISEPTENSINTHMIMFSVVSQVSHFQHRVDYSLLDMMISIVMSGIL